MNVPHKELQSHVWLHVRMMIPKQSKELGCGDRVHSQEEQGYKRTEAETALTMFSLGSLFTGSYWMVVIFFLFGAVTLMGESSLASAWLGFLRLAGILYWYSGLSSVKIKQALHYTVSHHEWQTIQVKSNESQHAFRVQWQSPNGTMSTKWDTIQKRIYTCWKCVKLVLLNQQCLEPRTVIKQGIWGHHITSYWSCPTLVDCPIHLTSTVGR